MGISLTYNWRLCVSAMYLVKAMAKVYNTHMVLLVINLYKNMLRGWK